MRARRLRMFAGPNGSGKSTIKDDLVKKYPKNFLGVYINPDDIEREIKSSGFINFGHFNVKTSEKKIIEFLGRSTLLADQGLLEQVYQLKFDKNRLYFEGISLSSYFVSPIADFLHESLIAADISFTFETVMSHPSKIDLLKRAKSAGFRNYLYYVAMDDPQINVTRVATRVKQGGHPVSKSKIVSRHPKTLDNLLDAIRATDRAYMFDNSAAKSIWFAEITEGEKVEILNSNVPKWFKKHVLEKGT